MFLVPLYLASQINIFHGTQIGKSLVRYMYQFLKIYIHVKNNTNTYTYKRKNTEKYTNE